MLIETLADVDDEIAEMFLDGGHSQRGSDQSCHPSSTIALKFTPVFMGSALANKSVQPMLDGVMRFPSQPLRGREHGS